MSPSLALSASASDCRQVGGGMRFLCSAVNRVQSLWSVSLTARGTSCCASHQQQRPLLTWQGLIPHFCIFKTEYWFYRCAYQDGVRKEHYPDKCFCFMDKSRLSPSVLPPAPYLNTSLTLASVAPMRVYLRGCESRIPSLDSSGYKYVRAARALVTLLSCWLSPRYPGTFCRRSPCSNVSCSWYLERTLLAKCQIHKAAQFVPASLSLKQKQNQRSSPAYAHNKHEATTTAPKTNAFPICFHYEATKVDLEMELRDCADYFSGTTILPERTRVREMKSGDSIRRGTHRTMR